MAAAAASSSVLSFTVGGRSDTGIDVAVSSILLRVLDLPPHGDFVGGERFACAPLFGSSALLSSRSAPLLLVPPCPAARTAPLLLLLLPCSAARCTPLLLLLPPCSTAPLAGLEPPVLVSSPLSSSASRSSSIAESASVPVSLLLVLASPFHGDCSCCWRLYPEWSSSIVTSPVPAPLPAPFVAVRVAATCAAIAQRRLFCPSVEWRFLDSAMFLAVLDSILDVSHIW